MLFSIITITLNNLAGLRRTAASLPVPAPELFEWIVIDGGSRDGTGAWLAGQNRRDLTWVSEPDQGIFDAMNKGLRRAKGCYALFMNAGDTLAPENVLARIAGEIGLRQPVMVYGDSIELGRNGATLRKAARSPGWNRYSLFTHHQSILYRRDMLGEGYDMSYRLSADWALTSRILARSDAAIQRFPGAICHFERGGISQSEAQRPLINAEHWRILREEMQLPLAFTLYRLKLAANQLRRSLPGVYDLLRFRKSRA